MSGLVLQGRHDLAHKNGRPFQASPHLRGLEQFPARGQMGDVGYCIAGATRYALEFSNDSDVICLLLGDIISESRFDDDGTQPLRFIGQSAAFHPRGGRVRVRADEVRQGFIAFSYPARFQELLDDTDIGPIRRDGSQVNIRRETLTALSAYALNRLRSGTPFSALELQSLASLVYLETVRGLGGSGEARRPRLSDRAFGIVCAFVDARLGTSLTCAEIAAAADLPLRAVFDGVKQRTGMSLYRFVVERRLARARELLTASNLTISEIALACGFSSQQHLTSVFSSKLGRTPYRLRRGD